MKVDARRGDKLLITDGPAAAIYEDGFVAVMTLEAALNRSYWEPHEAPIPADVPPDLGQRLASLRRELEADSLP